MKKILFLILGIFLFLTGFSQFPKVIVRSSQMPYYQGNARVKDSLGVDKILLLDTVKGNYDAWVTFKNAINVLGNATITDSLFVQDLIKSNILTSYSGQDLVFKRADSLYGKFDATNLFLGYNAGRNFNFGKTANKYNIFIGYESGKNDPGDRGFNTAIGYRTLYSNLGEDNVAIGANSLDSNTTGYKNTSIGRNSMHANTEGYANTAIGWGSLIANKTGYNNTAIGYLSLNYNTTGNNNIAIGSNAGGNNTTLSNRGFIGTYGRSSLLQDTTFSPFYWFEGIDPTTTRIYLNGSTFTNSFTSPNIYGGNLSTSDLTIKATSGVGASGSNIEFQRGDGGVAFQIDNGGNATFNYSNTIGTRNTGTIGLYSLSSGLTNISSGAYSISTGTASVASGYASSAFGNTCTSSGVSSSSFGNYVTSSNDNSFACGSYNNSSGINSFVTGFGNISSGANSFCIGYQARAIGYSSFAGGVSYALDTNYYAVKSFDTAGFSFLISLNRHAYNLGVSSVLLGGIDNYISIYSNYSCVLGGNTNTIDTGIVNSAIIGGHDITATRSNTVYVPCLEIVDSTVSDSLVFRSGSSVVNAAGVLYVRPASSGWGTIYVDSAGYFYAELNVRWNVDGTTAINSSFARGGWVTVGTAGTEKVSFYDGGTKAVIKNNASYSLYFSRDLNYRQ